MLRFFVIRIFHFFNRVLIKVSCFLKMAKDNNSNKAQDTEYKDFMEQVSRLFSEGYYSDVINLLEGMDSKKDILQSNMFLLKSYITCLDLDKVNYYWTQLSGIDGIFSNADFLQTSRLIINKFLDSDTFLESDFNRYLVKGLLSQKDEGELYRYPILAELLFELHEYDRKKFKVLYRYVSNLLSESQIDISSCSVNVSVALVVFDFISENDKKSLIRRNFLNYSISFHWSYLLIGSAWNARWDTSLKKSLDILKIVSDEMDFILHKGEDITPTEFYSLVLICSVCNRKYLPTLFQYGKSMLNRNSDMESTDDYKVINDISFIMKGFSKDESKDEKYSSNKKLKIAICISGQMRGWYDAFMSWKKYMITDENIEVTYFLHTWKDSGSSYPFPPKDERALPSEVFFTYRDVWNHFGQEDMLKRYPRFFGLWDDEFNVITEEFLKEVFDTDFVIVEDDSLEPFNQMSNAEKMYYKIMKCQELLDNCSAKFDLVVRIRPDFELLDGNNIDWFELYKECTKNNVIYCDAYARYFFPNIGYSIPDQLAIGTPQAIKSYSNAYEFTVDYMGQYHFSFFPDTFLAHKNVAYATLYSGYNINALALHRVLSPVKKPSREEIIQAFTNDAYGRMDSYDKVILNSFSS